MSAPTTSRPSGGTTKARAALTGSQIALVTTAAHKALTDCDVEIGPYKVNKIVRRFAKALVRSRMTFHEFLTDVTSQRRLKMSDPDLARVVSYIDRTGEWATWNADHPDLPPRGY